MGGRVRPARLSQNVPIQFIEQWTTSNEETQSKKEEIY
jgi:hypothetical protein